MSEKTIQYIIETIDKSQQGLNSAKAGVDNLQRANMSLQQASNDRIKAAIAGIRSERVEINNNTASIEKNTVAHRKNSVVATQSAQQQLNYGKRLNNQFNELATRMFGIAGAYATFRYLVNSLRDAGLNTEQFKRNLDSVSATIGNELLPLAEDGMKWFNENYQVITQTVINFGKTFGVVFNSLASLPVGAAAVFYKLRPIIDSALGIRGEHLEKSKRDAATYGKSFADSFAAEMGKIQTTIMSMTDLPEMKQKKPSDKKTSKTGVNDDYYKKSLQGMLSFNSAMKQIDKELLEEASANGEKWKEQKLKDTEALIELQTKTKESLIAMEQDETVRSLAELQLRYDQEISLYQNVVGAKEEIDKRYGLSKLEIENNSAARAKDIAEKERLMKMNNFQQIGGAFNTLMGAIGEATKENAKAQKAVAIVQAVINTALAITSALTMKPAPLGIAMAAIVGAAGAVQIGTIASQNFALGGYARRVPGAVSDKVPINVNPDEAIVTKRQQNNLTRFLNNPDTGSKGDTYNIYDYTGNLIETIQTMINSGRADRLNRTLNSRYAMA